MPSDRSLAYWQRVATVEGLILFGTAPLLLFPERFILLTALALLLLAGLWLAPLIIIRHPLIPATPQNTALVLFCLAASVGILVTADPGLTLPKATGLILGLGIWRYLVLAIRQRSQLDYAITAYLLGGLLFVSVGLLNANWVLKTTSQVPILGSLLSQQVSTATGSPWNISIHPNQVAGTITLILPLLAAVALKSFGANSGQRSIVRWIILLAALFCGAGLLLTQSRSGWASTLGGLLTLLVVGGLTMKPSKTRRFLRIFASLLISSLLLFLLWLGPQGLQQMWLDPPSETAVGSLSTLNFRQDLWPWAVQAVSDFPYTGIGLGAFRHAARRLYPLPIAPDFDFAHAHNFFVQVALDIGLVGLIAYLAILLICIVAAWQLARREQTLRAYSAGLLGSLTAFHLFGLTDALALGSKSAVLLWAIFGLLAVMIRLR